MSRFDRTRMLIGDGIDVLADKRVASGELIKFSGVAKRSGIERIFIAEKREGKSAE